METPEPLVICTDCGVRIGTGHVMRCLALAQVWKRVGGSVTFLVPEGSPGIEDRIRAEGCSVEVVSPRRFPQAAVDAVLQFRPRTVVLDGYGFGSDEQAALSHATIHVLTVDDFGHAREYPARWVLNQNPHARPETYTLRREDTRLLLGPAYALLRSEFLPWIGWRRTISDRAGSILITIGGSDPDNLSVRILESLALLGNEKLEVSLVVGGSNPHLAALQVAAERTRRKVNVITNSDNMPELMAMADIAVSGAGGTSYELCYMGLPSLLFTIAENQQGVAEHLSRIGAAVDAGPAHDFNPETFAIALRECIGSIERREEMSKRGRELVDGLGAERVKAALLDRELTLRLCCEADCQLLFSWANDPAVRKASFHSAPVAWEGHRQWFSEKLRSEHSVIYIGENREGQPVGQVRFHVEGERATLSIAVSPEFRGGGWGRELIALASRTLARSCGALRVEALVKPENQASIRLFESSGFRREGSTEVSGQTALRFVG